jgi:Recombination endonuclease VII
MQASISSPKKRCTRCRELRTLDQFTQKPSGSYQSWCIPCHNTYNLEKYHTNPNKRQYGLNKNLKQMYGITLEQYNALLVAQGGVCAICKQAETWVDSRTQEVARLRVDHCHVTGKVRALLCSRCNSVIGVLETNLEQIDVYLHYIQYHQQH